MCIRDSIERVRAAYLTKRSRTVGWYEPDGSSGAADDAADESEE